MQVSADQALSFYHRLDASQQVPSLHPLYILADAQRSITLIPRFFVYQEREHFYYHAFHIEAVPGTDLYDIQSPYGYGGAVATTTSPAFLQKAWAAYSAWCQGNNILVEFVRFHPLLENWCYFSGEVHDDRRTVWVDLSLPDPMSGYVTRVRTAIRKAITNGLRIEWCEGADFFTSFPAIYEETMKMIGADNFYLFPSTYYQKIIDPRIAKLAICRDEKNIYAGAIFLIGLEVVEYHLSACNSLGRALGATNLMLHEAICWARLAGKKRLHLGGGTNADEGNKLLFFKAGFSDRRSIFKIGKIIHLPVIYGRMKQNCDAQLEGRSNRILFYR